ncbi:hypothetical protein OG612_03960 [Streptomyces sp. NBC_01527]|nr:MULTISPECIES: hypothetical protein [unclassified Streptomyces]WSQ31461.1 hypothetical protein OG763_39755 [Streptomyces sp. NBC_01230]
MTRCNAVTQLLPLLDEVPAVVGVVGRPRHLPRHGGRPPQH